jgi:hypothetical protein
MMERLLMMNGFIMNRMVLLLLWRIGSNSNLLREYAHLEQIEQLQCEIIFPEKS